MYGNQPYSSYATGVADEENDHLNPPDSMSDVGSDIMTVTDLHTLSGLSSDGVLPMHHTSHPSSSSTRHRIAQPLDPPTIANTSTISESNTPVYYTMEEQDTAGPMMTRGHVTSVRGTSLMTSRFQPTTGGGPPSLHDVDGDTFMSGSDVHTINDDIFTVDGGTVGVGGETTTTKEGSSEVYDRHAASLGQAQYYKDANSRADVSQVQTPSEHGATRGSTAEQHHWDVNAASAASGQVESTPPSAAAGFWNRAFRKPSTTMPSEEDDERIARASILRDFNGNTLGHPPVTPTVQRVTNNNPTLPPTMIIVGSSSQPAKGVASQHSRALSTDTDEIGSVWKQRLCGLRADRLVVLLLLVLLVAVAVIVGAIVLTEQATGESNTSAASSRESSGVSNTNGGLFDRSNETVSLTRTPTSAATENVAPPSLAPVAISAKASKTSEPTLPVTSPPGPDTAFPTTPAVVETNQPSITPATACFGVTDDITVVFPIGDRDRTCSWLINRPVERERQCVEGRLGFDFCRATCSNCAPLPPGATSFPWPERCGSDADSTQSFEVEENTNGNCAWLSSSGTATHLEKLCQPGMAAFNLCRETCRNCGRAVAPSDPPSFSPSMPLIVSETTSPTGVPVVANETAFPTMSATVAATGAPVTAEPTSAPTVFPVIQEPTTSEPVEEPLTTAEPGSAPETETPAPTVPVDEDTSAGVTGSSLEDLQALVLEASPNSQSVLENGMSEQFRALEWIQERVADGSFGADVSEDRIVQKWALACFAYSIDWDDEWFGSGTDECVWDGITCNEASVVTAIVLDNRGIRGGLVPELSLLFALERLIVSENSMSGDLPSSFGDLSNLQDFRMDRNDFSGELPDTIGGMRSLRIWYMERNANLAGSFTDSLLSLENLEELVFYYTSIVGELPDGVCDIASLESLILDCRQVQSDCWTQCFYRCGGETGIPCTRE